MMLVTIIAVVLFQQASCMIKIPSSCPGDLQFNEIPSDHLFHKISKPVIIAHRGTPKEYQENTYDGIINALDSNADGFELDIYKTKDDKLVVFHDDNTERMTGTNMVIYNSTYEELLQLNITDKITAGGTVYKFDKKRKIPLLEDILKVSSTRNILHYLEMKPSDPFRPHELQLAKDTARLVAEMIVKMNLERRAIIISFDFRKIKHLKSLNSNITTGTLFTPKSSYIPKEMYLQLQELGELQKCIRDAPNGTFEFFQFILESGIFFKYSGSSSFDCDIKLYDNPKFSNNTLAALRKSLGSKVSTGFYTVYSMGKTEQENSLDEVKVTGLLKQGGGQRLITDDVARARKLVGKTSSKGSTLHYSNMSLLSVCLVTLIFCF